MANWLFVKLNSWLHVCGKGIAISAMQIRLPACKANFKQKTEKWRLFSTDPIFSTDPNNGSSCVGSNHSCLCYCLFCNMRHDSSVAANNCQSLMVGKSCCNTQCRCITLMAGCSQCHDEEEFDLKKSFRLSHSSPFLELVRIWTGMRYVAKLDYQSIANFSLL